MFHADETLGDFHLHKDFPKAISLRMSLVYLIDAVHKTRNFFFLQKKKKFLRHIGFQFFYFFLLINLNRDGIEIRMASFMYEWYHSNIQ